MEPNADSPAWPATTSPAPALTARYRILALGRAGMAAIHPLLSAGLSEVEFAVLDTDPEALAQSPVPHRLHFGEAATFGLGTGSDPARGRAAAEADLDHLRPLVAGARLVFIVAGLGGGTGSGAAPVLARLAREAGALTLGIATLPFDCEGRLRAAHAREALTTFRSNADAVICVPKQRVLAQYKDHERPALTDVLDAANQLAGQSIIGLIKLLTRPGLMPLDFAHLERLLRGRHAESCFAAVETTGTHRTRDAVDQLLRHPFLDRGQALTDANAVLLSIAAGPEVTFTEIDRVFTHLQNVCEHAEVITGTSIDAALEGRLVVTVIASRSPAAPMPMTSGNSPMQTGATSGNISAAPSLPQSRPDSGAALGPDLLDPTQHPGASVPTTSGTPMTPAFPSGRVLPLPVFDAYANLGSLSTGPGMGPGKTSATSPVGAGGVGGMKKKNKPIQSLLNFSSPTNRGRFEGIPATIYQGEDLDIPTYARRGISLN